VKRDGSLQNIEEKMKTILIIASITFIAALLQSTSVQAGNFFQSFKFGLEAGYFNYQEPGLIESDGGLAGAFGEYKLHFSDSLILPDTLIIDGNIKAGRTDFTSYGRGELEDQDNFVSEIRANLGKEFNILNSVYIMPYAGIGYRYQNTDPSANGSITTTGHYLKEQEVHYLYLPLGIKTGVMLLSNWAVEVTAEFDVFLDGTQKSFFNNINTHLDDVEEDLSDGYGFRGSIAFIQRTPVFDLSIEPFIRWWDIDNSKNTSVVCNTSFCARGFEPDNETYEVGVRFGFSF
jgi:hypothetical protein